MSAITTPSFLPSVEGSVSVPAPSTGVPKSTAAVEIIPGATTSEELDAFETRLLGAVQTLNRLAVDFCAIRRGVSTTGSGIVALQKQRSHLLEVEELLGTQGLSDTGGQVLQIESGWASSIPSLRSTLNSLVQLIVENMCKGEEGQALTESVGGQICDFWPSTSTDLHADLFLKCVILLSLRVLEHKALDTLRSPPVVCELPNVKAFVYPYLVSNRFRNAMLLLAGLVARKLKAGSRDGQEIALDLESWESPKLLSMIEGSFRAWNVVALKEFALNGLSAEAVTAVSKEDMSISTIVCAVQQPALLRLEQLLGSSEPEGESAMSLKWDKVCALELMAHEFCRVWRRMLRPAGEPCTPLGVGEQDEPNAGCALDSLLWGPLLSTDIHFQTGEVLCERRNTLNLYKALDICSWEDPAATFPWTQTPVWYGHDIAATANRTRSRSTVGLGPEATFDVMHTEVSSSYVRQMRGRRTHADHLLAGAL